MRYTQLTDADVRHMLDTIGVSDVDALFAGIGESYLLRERLRLPAEMDEPALLAHLEALADRNRTCAELTCFLGGGSYDHFIPTIVDALAGQGEFVTAYTPYQAEASQGILQAFYEFQTMVCQLTGMEIANASLYEQTTAAAEAVLMAHQINKRPRLLVSEAVHPETLAVLETYTRETAMVLEPIAAGGGVTNVDALASALDDRVAAVVVQSPNFFGCIEPLMKLTAPAADAGAMSIVSADPISCGVLKSPGACGADVVVGEGQPLGIPMSFGGPYLGLLATRKKYLRKIPGRLVGRTRDAENKPAYCLSLQTREQHIRREKATSNVCTNQGLLAMRACVYMAAMGRNGIRQVARLCLDKAHYAADRIAALDGYELRFDAPFFKEFVVRTTHDVDRVLSACRDRGILAGLSLRDRRSDLKDCFLVAVTERRTKAEIDSLVEALAGV